MASRHYNSGMAEDKPNYPSDAAEKFIVRLPPGMREQIAEAAKGSGRSMNAEVVARLGITFAAPTEPYATKSQLERSLSKLSSHYDSMLVSVGLVRDMLATYVRQLNDKLSPKAKENAEVVLAVQLANAVLHANAETVSDSFKRLMHIINEEQGNGGIEGEDAFYDEVGKLNRTATLRHRPPMLPAKTDDSKP